jgi:hypothetical protein
MSQSGFKRHITKRHKSEKEKIYLEENKNNPLKCEYCNRYFKSLSALNNHRIRTHNATNLIKLPK